MGMKNDLSFLLYDHLPLYEHQSTDNPNLPLRDLLYIAEIYTNKVRTYRRTMALEDAVELAIRQCIEEGILTELLSRHRAEVKQVSIFEYDEEKHIRQEREDAWEDGHSAGKAEGKAEGVRETQAELVRKLLGRGEDPGEVAKLMGVTEEEVLRLMEAL